MIGKQLNMTSNYKRLLCFVVLSIVVLTFFFVFFNNNCSVGFYLYPHESGLISCQETDKNNLKKISVPQSTAMGAVSFRLDSDSRHFSFIFKPSEKPYKIKSISLLGIPLFSANWIASHLKPPEKLYELQFLSNAEPLEFKITDVNKDVDFVRFFDVIVFFFRWGKILTLGLILILILIGVFALTMICFPKAALRLNMVRAQCPPLFQQPILFYTLLFFVLLFLLPSPVIPIQPGLDPSWQWLLNKLAFSKSFGADIIFTYGPLCFILYPQAVGYNVWITLVCNVAYLITYAGLLIYLYNQVKTRKTLVLFFFVCALIPFKNREWEWTLLPILMIGVIMFHKGMSRASVRWLSILSAILCSFVGLIKYSSCVIFVLTIIVSLVYLFFFNRQYLRTYFISQIMTFVFCLVVARQLFFPSYSALFAWHVSSLDVATGYNLCMLSNQSWIELMIPFLYVLTMLLLLLIGNFNRNRFCMLMVFAPLIFCLIKYSILRQGFGALLYVGVNISTLYIIFVDKEWLSRWLTVFKIQLGGTVLISALFILLGVLPVNSTPGYSLVNLRKTLFLFQSIEESKAQTRELLKKSVLQKDWLEIIGTNVVQCLPFESSYIPANNLSFVPFFTLQSYGAYTYSLDHKSAAVLNFSPPLYILCEFANVDGRNFIIESPAVWTLIRNNYELLRADDHLLLLRRVLHKSSFEKTNQKRCFINQGEWVEADALNADYVSIVWQHTFTGKMVATLFRNAITHLTVEYADGSIKKYRVLPGTLRTPFLLNGIPRCMEDLKSLYSKDVNLSLRVKRFRLDSNNSLCYMKEIELIY
jgi:hypothetical protein